MSPPHSFGCSTAMTRARPHKQLCGNAAVGTGFADPASDNPQGDGVLIVPIGQQPDEVAHLRRQSHSIVDVGLAGLRLGEVEHIPRLGYPGRAVPGVGEPIPEIVAGTARTTDNGQRA